MSKTAVLLSFYDSDMHFSNIPAIRMCVLSVNWIRIDFKSKSLKCEDEIHEKNIKRFIWY